MDHSGQLIDLDGGRLYCCANRYQIDGRVTWHPASVRGFAPMNCYVLVEPGAAMLIDSGLSIHREALLRALRTILAPTARLSVLHTRLGEYNSLCNTPAVIAEFDVDVVHGAHANAALWTYFEPREDSSDPLEQRIKAVKVNLLGGRNEIVVGGERRVEAFAPALRLLPTHWVWDAATGTLFTSDMFSHVHRTAGRGPWLVTGDADDTEIDTVREHMLATRYWWLDGADTESIQAWLAELFERLPVQRIAPGYGCVLEGSEVVANHLAMVQDVLGAAAAPRHPTALEPVR